MQESATRSMTLLVGVVSLWACSAFAQIGAPPTAPSAQPSTADDYFHRGIAKQSNGDLDGAIADYAKSIELKPDFAVAYDYRGIAKQYKCDLDGAIADYTEAIQLKSDDAEAYIGRGNAKRTKGDLDGAIADYTKATAHLKSTQGDLGVRSGLIATNGNELAALKLRGERNYTDVKLGKTKKPVKFADITLLLKDVDLKKNRYTVQVMADDKLTEKKDKNINEAVQFYTAKGEHVPYELVINQVNKNQIVGYLSLPKAEASPANAQGQISDADSLTKLVERGDLDALRTRLSSGADPNESDGSVAKCWTPLMVAAALGDVNAARLLLDRGAAIDAKTEFGKTALDVAVRGGCSTCSNRTGSAQVAELLRSRSSKDSELPNELIEEESTQPSTQPAVAQPGTIPTPSGPMHETAIMKDTQRSLGFQGESVATSANELAALRQRGGRNYWDIKLGMTKQPVRFADITIKLISVDPKNNTYTVDVLADDKLTQKKDKKINEPVQFYTAKGGHIPYELVINQIGEDQIVGYLATPKVEASR